jgi:hypothetical protein
MPLFHRLTHLSRLTFFVSMGVVATLLDACVGKRNDEHAPTQPGAGGSSANALTHPGSSGASIVGPTVGNGGGAAAERVVASAGSDTLEATRARPRKPTGPQKNAKQKFPMKDDGLHDIICE